MKMFFVLFALVATQAQAQEFRTQDNVAYIISTTREAGESQAAYNKCFKQVCALALKHGTGECTKVWEDTSVMGFGVFVANLTTYGADKVSRLKCISSVEAERRIEAYPRLGRSN